LAATATRDHTRFDFDTHANRYTYEAALRSAGAGVTAIDRAMRDEPRAICVTRPPGHHAERERAMGFCFLNNVAIAAEHAIAAHGMSRVAIVDWDVHHGNGTQHHFYSRSDVFYVSIHQYPHYPGTGAAGGKGEGPGAGFTLNIPLEPGAGDDKYCRLFDTVILPLLEQYQPQMILVSAGFDGHRRDPLGGMDLTGAGYSSMAKRLCDLSGRYSDGRVVVLLEGGYDLAGLTEGVGAVVEELSLVS
jgi:acetoin utilization deacetylase AcuC-like enzyme